MTKRATAADLREVATGKASARDRREAGLGPKRRKRKHHAKRAKRSY